MRIDPRLEGADLQLRAARYDYRQVAPQLARLDISLETVERYEFAEKCFQAAEKTIWLRAKRQPPDAELARIWASTDEARNAVLKLLSWASRSLHVDPRLTGADALRWICTMPRRQERTAPRVRTRGLSLTDALLIFGAAVMVAIFLWR